MSSSYLAESEELVDLKLASWPEFEFEEKVLPP